MKAQDHYIEYGIGDHVSISYKAVPLTSTAFYYHIVKLGAEFAAILGQTEDQQRCGINRSKRYCKYRNGRWKNYF